MKVCYVGVQMVKKWIRSNDQTPVLSPFFHRLLYSRVTGVSSFLRGSSSFGAAQPVFETLLPRIITVMRAWRVLRRYATDLLAQNKRLKFQSVARVPDLSAAARVPRGG
jgi:hypothetical protein